MSVLIKGMVMPKDCTVCPLQFGGFCYASPPEIDERVAPTVDEAWNRGRPDWCPLVELPERHGRLTDADALIRDHFSPEHRIALSEANKIWMRKIINDAPTIVEAEGGCG